MPEMQIRQPVDHSQKKNKKKQQQQQQTTNMAYVACKDLLRRMASAKVLHGKASSIAHSTEWWILTRTCLNGLQTFG